jgi:dihydrofolate reductase
MKISLIAAAANNHVIGNENSMIWHLPADMKHFRTLTMNHTLIMGRKTFESIGAPLKGRTTIILSRHHAYPVPEGCKLANSLADAIRLVMKEKEVFVAGGEDIYRQAIDLHYTKKIYLTRIFANFDGDAFFPEIDPEKWELTDRQDHQPDEKNIFPYSFQLYKRKISCRN